MIIMVVASAIFMGVHRTGTFEIDRDKKIPEAKARQANRDSTLLFVMKIVAIVIAGISAILFFNTENMDGNAPIVNNYTYIHCILFVIFIAILVIGNKEAKSVDKVLRERQTKADGFFLD
jgi:anaerobic C4-dicarboxylate transporter